MENVLALITARGGSKGIPGKNLKPLNGRPLISYSIEAAMKSKYLLKSNIICSTDSPEIASVARYFGATVPFLRPNELANDQARSIDVAIHAIGFMEKERGRKFDFILLLQPTSPLRTEKDIDAAFEIMFTKNPDSVISVVEPSISPFNMKILNREGELEDLLDDSTKFSRRQDMPDVWGVNGAIYIARRETILNENSFFGNHSLPYVMSKEKSVDIDELHDFKLAEFFLAQHD